MKTALVTGSAKRVGAELVCRLASLGYFTWVHYRQSQKEAEDTLQQIQSAGYPLKSLKPPCKPMSWAVST